eukprot:TRINITY_DN62186_c0_g1_i1.p1 TRINITY_DN62186_c0_g1~~TRINITY_DN62186_c0_g1_i1.p1  ORF type:complete len:616 (+),score=88.05 TRINITY_DN62186_c0_g1_i1:35-1882(+)
MTQRPTARDHTTQSNYEDITVKHVSLDWRVDFDAQSLIGSATLTVRTGKDDMTVLDLDSRELSVKSAELKDGDNFVEAKFEVGEAHKALGSRLRVTLPRAAKKDTDEFVRITYQTAPTSSALCWMPPEQTDGGKHPYLFSQCQAIHARSMFPCQDTPGVKITYSAKVTVPKDLTALMSAIGQGEPKVEGDFKVCAFEQPVGIPAYLTALVVGELVGRDISKRVRVWSEPCKADASEHEFQEAEGMVATAEGLVGEYVWGRYDILVLPGSFPYGGMENPCLTFVTPTLLAGDRSLADVVAHEISHSWTGNLVTNATWEDFWLNEGFTMFLQRLIVKTLHKDERLFDFDAIIGWSALQADVKNFGETNDATRLRPDLSGGVDPDDVFSSVPYEKGFNLLYYLMKLVGGLDVFVPWFKDYIQTFKHKCVTTTDFQKHITEYFTKAGKGAEFEKVDWVTWFDKPGMPPRIPGFSTELADNSTNLGKKWIAGGEGCEAKDIEGWVTGQKLVFLDTVLEAEKPLSLETVQKMEKTYAFNESNNAEVLAKWLGICLASGYTDCLPKLKNFLTIQGRMKFVRPLYRAWAKLDKPAAQEFFQSNMKKYHNIASKLLAKDFGIEG